MNKSLVVFFIYSAVLLKSNFAQECNPSIVERSNFVAPVEENLQTATTNLNIPTVLRENDPRTIANAKVVLKFSGDKIEGENGINGLYGEPMSYGYPYSLPPYYPGILPPSMPYQMGMYGQKIADILKPLILNRNQYTAPIIDEPQVKEVVTEEKKSVVLGNRCGDEKIVEEEVISSDCQRNPLIPFGKRFPYDEDKLNEIHSYPWRGTSALSYLSPGYINEISNQFPLNQIPQPWSGGIAPYAPFSAGIEGPMIPYGGYPYSHGCHDKCYRAPVCRKPIEKTFVQPTSPMCYTTVKKLVKPSQCYKTIDKYEIPSMYRIEKIDQPPMHFKTVERCDQTLPLLPKDNIIADCDVKPLSVAGPSFGYDSRNYIGAGVVGNAGLVTPGWAGNYLNRCNGKEILSGCSHILDGGIRY